MRRLAGRLGLGVVGRAPAGSECPAVEEGRYARRPAADLEVVEARRVPGVAGGGVLDRGVRCAGGGSVRREAIREVRAAGQGGGVGLHLQVPLVHEPVPYVDRERQRQQQHRQQERKKHGDPAALLGDPCEGERAEPHGR
jgi:hypothetical protein